MFGQFRIVAVLLIALLFFKSCDKAPKYEKPSVQTPGSFKEITPENFKETDNWKYVHPQDNVIRDNWWELFHDPQLNTLEAQVDISNQNIAAAEASFRVAKDVVKESRSQLFPTVTSGPAITVSRQSARLSQSTFGAGRMNTEYSLPFDASWEIDLWHRIRNTVKANAFEAQATVADLENVRLSVRGEVAFDYYELRALDGESQLLNSTVLDYQKALDLTKVRLETGISSLEDVSQAETQLKATQAQATDLGIQRAQLEHAIALLLGQPASTFSIPVQPLEALPPPIPLGVPSQLLERRPDIAASERRMAEANAEIGVAKAAFFPSLVLNGAVGFESTSIATWLTWPARFFALGPSLSQTIFDKGRRRAATDQARAEYDLTVANYRQSVLTAFQEVEDNLAALRILSLELKQQDEAIASAQTTLALADDRYKSGIDSYLNVITAQTTLLTNQRVAVNLRMEEMTASVLLIKSLGGSWNVSKLPSQKDLLSKGPTPRFSDSSISPVIQKNRRNESDTLVWNRRKL